MALLDTFKKKKDEKDSEVKKTKASNSSSPASKKENQKKEAKKDTKNALSYTPQADLEHVLLRPHVTEKAALLAEKNVHVFQIDPRAGKRDVQAAISSIYNVVPKKISIVKLPSKNVVSRGKRGVKSGKKKAIVYLKKGDSIEVMTS